MSKTLSFEDHYNEACQLAFEEVKKRARIILKKRPNLDEFVMGMGAWFFTTKDGRNTDGSVEFYNETSGYFYLFRSWVQPISDIICKWDEVLKITGNPVRFTAKGPEVVNW